jgi:hypothetical protein
MTIRHSAFELPWEPESLQFQRLRFVRTSSSARSRRELPDLAGRSSGDTLPQTFLNFVRSEPVTAPNAQRVSIDLLARRGFDKVRRRPPIFMGRRTTAAISMEG